MNVGITGMGKRTYKTGYVIVQVSEGMTFICLDQTNALEFYMALVEEEMYETFYAMCQDRFEDADQDWEERAQWMRLWDTLWEVMEVPIIYGNTCC